MDRLKLIEVQCPARVGLTQAQRAKKQTILVDLELEVDVSMCAEKDDFRLAVDYWAIEKGVREALESKPWKLLEAMAEQAASLILAQHSAVAAVVVRARKRPSTAKNRREIVALARRARSGPHAPDCVQVLGIECRARVGVPEEERAKPQRILLDLELRADFSACAKKDDPRLAVDAEAAAELAREAVESEPWRLVEALAARAAEVVLAGERRCDAVAVRARKAPAVMPRTKEVAVELLRGR